MSEPFDYPSKLPAINAALRQEAIEYRAERGNNPAPVLGPRIPRPTPKTTIEAIIYCVQQRGLSALKETANIERLSRCDEAARAEIKRRISRRQP
jgi:hypothetical protein